MLTPKPPIYPDLVAYVAEVQAESHLIPAERKRELRQLARFIAKKKGTDEIAKVVFICTHNSRRSHLAQIWTQTAAHMYGITGVEAYSGGTEATAFNPRAVAALERAGFRVRAATSGDNPVYAVRFSDEVEPMECFSKVYDHPPNPKDGFCAIMTCSAADAGCPVVFGASERIAMRYDDPKTFDGSDQEELMYDERCRQIAREMMYAASRGARSRL